MVFIISWVILCGLFFLIRESMKKEVAKEAEKAPKQATKDIASEYFDAQMDAYIFSRYPEAIKWEYNKMYLTTLPRFMEPGFLVIYYEDGRKEYVTYSAAEVLCYGLVEPKEVQPVRNENTRSCESPEIGWLQGQIVELNRLVNFLASKEGEESSTRIKVPSDLDVDKVCALLNDPERVGWAVVAKPDKETREIILDYSALKELSGVEKF